MLEGLNVLEDAPKGEDFSTEAMLRCELEFVEAERDYLNAIYDFKNLCDAQGNLFSVSAALEEFGLTEELKAMVGKDLESIGIDLTSSTEALEKTKEFISKAWDKFIAMLKTVKDFFIRMWNKFMGFFGKKTKEVKSKVAEVKAAPKENVEEKFQQVAEKEIDVPTEATISSPTASHVEKLGTLLDETAKGIVQYNESVIASKVDATEQDLAKLVGGRNNIGLLVADKLTLKVRQTKLNKIKFKNLMATAGKAIELVESMQTKSENMDKSLNSVLDTASKAKDHMVKLAEEAKTNDKASKPILGKMASNSDTVSSQVSKLCLKYIKTAGHIISQIAPKK